jgi:hypothetical protein
MSEGEFELARGSATSEIWARVGDELLKWFALGVVVAALPIIFNGVDFAIREQAFSFRALARHGELFLVSVAIIAASLGELPMAQLSGWTRVARTLLLGSSIVLICLCSLCFADVASLLQDDKHYNTSFVATGSLFLFFLSMVTAGCSVALGETFRDLRSWPAE